MAVATSKPSKFDRLFFRLAEAPDPFAYDCVERLISIGAEAGFSPDDMIHLLDQGMKLADLLETIETRIGRATPIAAA